MQSDPVKDIHAFFSTYIGTKPKFFEIKEKKMRIRVEEVLTDGPFDLYSAAYVLYSLCKWPPLVVQEGNFLNVVDINVCREFILLLFNYLSRNGCKDYILEDNNEAIRKKSK